jgi:hypothetical protein
MLCGLSADARNAAGSGQERRSGKTGNRREQTGKQSETNDKKAVAQQISKLGGRLKMAFEPSERITINVDAEIISRGYDKLPLVRVRPKNFSTEQFEAFAKYLTKGQPLYYMDWDLGTYTKEEIEAILPRIEMQLESGALSNKNILRDIIEELKLEYETAISKADETLYDGKPFLATENGEGCSFYLKCYMGKDKAAWLTLDQSPNGTSTQMLFENSDYNCGYNTYEPYEGKDALGSGITYEEAKAMAEEFVRAMDGETSNLELSRSSICWNDFNYTKETSPQGYSFVFYRSYNGVEAKSVLAPEGTGIQSEYGEQAEEADYRWRVSPEVFIANIDHEGIKTACWQNQTDYIETVAEDTPLLDFNTVKGIFENYCKYRFSWAPPYDGMPKDMGVTFNVKRIELNLMVIPEKDNLENYITVPVWDFIADQEYEEGFTDQEGNPFEGNKDISILTINAVNGTIISRGQGY